MNRTRYRWAAPGDVNAFFGLMLDNVADLLMTVGLLHAVFAFPTKFALRHMIPGTAIGVLVGDLLFFFLALRLARSTGRNNITAMPLGLDTPSTFGMVLLVLGPAFLRGKTALGLPEHDAALYAWRIGICSLLISGLFKLACALGAHWIRRLLPRAGLLGSLAAIALVLISFLPLLEILHSPVVGWVSLAVILTTLVARVSLPLRIPGALGALLIGGTLHYLMLWSGLGGEVTGGDLQPADGLWPTEWLTVFRGEWMTALGDSLAYLPIVLPFALATVVGGIDCTESAAAAGDEFDTRQVIGVEALATLVAALCGGVIQTTPYIGHPAYKAMGGRAAYTLATALFVGSAGLLGYFGYLYVIIPKAAVFPILVFVGLEITAQSFHATPRRHYAAVGLACVPALASLALLYVDKLQGALVPPGTTPQYPAALQAELDTLRLLANGFVVTSLLWASLLAALIDRHLLRAAAFSGIAALCTLCGIIHSPLPGNPVFLPWQLADGPRHSTVAFALAYLGVATLLVAWSFANRALGVADGPPGDGAEEVSHA
ncbi:MAG: permease [Pirellulales bacterium]